MTGKPETRDEYSGDSLALVAQHVSTWLLSWATCLMTL